MPISIYQFPLQKGLLQTEFYPNSDAVVTLHKNGDMASYSIAGSEEWRFSLPFDPLAFRINAGGDLIAVLGEGTLAFYDVWSGTLKTVAVGDKFTSLDFHKNCAVLSGYLDHYLIVTPGGKTLKTVSLDALIRQMRTVPLDDHLLIHNQDYDLICADIDGETAWVLEGYRIHGGIEVSNGGQVCSFIKHPSSIVRFDVGGDNCFEAPESNTLRQLSLSRDGKYLLVLDVDNRLKLMDHELRPVWDSRFEHTIRVIRISRNGGYFLSVDKDNVLTCYDVRSTAKTSSAFLELEKDQRIIDRQPNWTVTPGGRYHHDVLHLLTVSPDGTGIAAVGKANSVHFLDDRGKSETDVSFPAYVESIGLSDSRRSGYIYGDRQIKTVDFASGKVWYTVLRSAFHGRPLISFFHERLFLISKEQEIQVYDFEGKLDHCFEIPAGYRRGLSCGQNGIVLHSDQDIISFSEEGQTHFRSRIEGGILGMHHSGSNLFCITNDACLLSIDLSRRKGRRKRLAEKGTTLHIVGFDPLRVVGSDHILYLLDDTLNIAAKHGIRSTDSLFCLDEGRLCEIARSRKGLTCYDGNGDMIWRYRSQNPVKEAVLMRNGVAFIDEDAIHHVALKQATDSQSDYSQFLEL